MVRKYGYVMKWLGHISAYPRQLEKNTQKSYRIDTELLYPFSSRK